MTGLKCSICFELFDIHKIFAGSCGHTFHEHCILQWVNGAKACPKCRKRLTKNDINKLYFDTASRNDTLPINLNLQNELDSKDTELKAKNAELASSLKKVKDLQDHAATTEQLYHNMHQKYLATQSELESSKLRLKKVAKQETKMENLERENVDLRSQLINLRKIQTVLYGTQHEAEDILREQGILVAQEVGRSNAKNMANLCSILKRELFKLRAQKAEQKKKEVELLLQLGIKNAKLKKMQESRENLKRRFSILDATPRRITSEAYFADVSTNTTENYPAIQLTSVATEGEHVKQVTPIATEGEHAQQVTPIATEGEHATQVTPIADGKVTALSFIKGGGNLDVTPIPYNFSDKKKPIMKKVVLDKPSTQSLSFINPVNHFPKPVFPPFNNKIDMDSDSITRVGYNGLGGHERVIFPRARELSNYKPYKKNPNVKKGK